MLEPTTSKTRYWRNLFLILSALALSILACKLSKTTPTTQVLPTVGAGGAGGNQAGPLKPVGFVNHGSIAATVMAWTYKPLNSDSAGIPSNASTVSFPPTAPGLWPNSSRFLLLPMGTYTWCYHWELGDVNKDGMMDYAHAIDNRPVVLDESDSDDTEDAEQVDINVPPGSGELPGRCGQLADMQASPLKPVCFLNIGTTPATVMAWTYIPLNTESPAMPSDASTVASPGGNPSACLSLPLGTYTWCYHWELGDINDDSMIDYAHAINLQKVVLDESDSDDLDLAEKVTLSAPPGIGEQPGLCDLETRTVLDIRPYIVESQHIDSYHFGYSTVGLAHNEDYVTLKGPITVDYYFHHCDAAPCTTPVIIEPPVRVTIPAGETYKFYLEDTVGAHLGNWDMYIQLISIDG